MIPFLKWAGGKRWFTKKFGEIFPQRYNTYIEPFIGGGSVFFYLKPNRAIIGDINEELVLTYRSIKENWAKVNELLEVHQRNHSNDYYYLVRESIPHDQYEKAARLIYLNRTCFNGIYRVNLQGVFNVPKGTKDSVILDSDNFEGISQLLTNTQIWNADFEFLINNANQDDLVFADPPYTVRHNQNGFIKYNENLFSWNDQLRLADALLRAKQRGAIVIATNANHQLLRELYQERGFEINTVSRYSSISADPKKRNQYEEIIVHTNLEGGRLI
ncbi:Dam family site-specific DNA-(adenine-N6)-methyltransferase [Paenibacillus hemerocallicola]|uniref:Site-specific DNA-methyltransferase (adenine-specific) n=1 Tax=Paenibacillus hemerocallicola TaxID=1172614 RepID=A0A5C4SV40_9BACL|nr:Dam family site-specific DNA-(adenine-N6)-methyltransferase [Paenibacillus hemerocallicola]